VALGPVDVTWSMEVFYALKDSDSGKVGHISQNGLFTPADVNPEANFDVWAVATARSEEDKNGKPLVGKSYLVVTVPWYTFNGRRYVRNLDRWVDDGPATGRQ
jgi:quinohemoprotein amine dehydrogenase